MAIPATFESKFDSSRGLSALFTIGLPAIIYGVEISGGRSKFPFDIPGWSLILLAMSALATGFWARHWFVWASEKALPWTINDKYLHRWFVGQLISALYAEFIALLGILWRLQGCSFRSAAVFYIAGFTLLLLWFPRRPRRE
jgi:hypothetical protein